MGHGGGTPGDGERPDMSDENGGQMPDKCRAMVSGRICRMVMADRCRKMVTGRMAVLEHRHG